MSEEIKGNSLRELLIKKTTDKKFIKSEKEFYDNYDLIQKDHTTEEEQEEFNNSFFYPVINKETGKMMVVTKDENLRKNLLQKSQKSFNILLKYAAKKEDVVYVESNLYFSLIGDTAVMSTIYTDEDAKTLFRDLFTDAGRKNASDIHISWEAGKVAVKFRIDGKLRRQSTKISPSLGLALKNILVNKAGESEYEENEIAGAITEIIDGEKQEYRVSIGPTHYGNIIVIRLESSIDNNSNLERWGYYPKAIEVIRELYAEHHGIVLVTGATGSGKSTLLYTIMIERKNLNPDEDPEILTVEDPVEIPISGINQVQVNTKGDPKNHMTYARAIRMFLRQDPDMIVVGEIRDQEVAIQAVTAAKTGHLTFSTLHTNDVKSTMTRLNELGIDNTNIEDALKGVISQRLLNKLCQSCKIKTIKNGVEYYERNDEGCSACRKSQIKGYVGRVPVVEIAVLNNKKENYKRENFEKYLSLEENIIWLLEEGIIDEEEAQRFIKIDDESDIAKRKEFLSIWGKASIEKGDSQDIFPVYQKIFDTMEYPLAQEAYVRMRSSNGTLMTPKQIIDISRDSDLFYNLSIFILDRVIENVEKTNLLTFVNINKELIEAKGFVDEIFEKITSVGLKEKIVFEIEFSKNIAWFLKKCNEEGFLISIDNFSGNITDIIYMHKNNIELDYIKTTKHLIEGVVYKENWIENYLEILEKQNAKVIINYVETKDIYKNIVEKYKNKIFGLMGFGLHRPEKG